MMQREKIMQVAFWVNTSWVKAIHLGQSHLNFLMISASTNENTPRFDTLNEAHEIVDEMG